MECQPSRFVEIAERSRAKRAQLYEQMAAREAKKAREDAEVDAARSLKFAYEMKKLKEVAAGLKQPISQSKPELEETDSSAVEESDFNLEQYDFAAEAIAPSDSDLDELDETQDPFWEDIRNMLRH